MIIESIDVRSLAYILSAVMILFSIHHAYAQKVFEQGVLVEDAGGRYRITCYSEPAHPAGVSGSITIFADRPYSKSTSFSTGDFNSNGVSDDHATVIFPDEFTGASMQARFDILCSIWSGNDEDEEEDAYSSVTAEFWQSMFVDNSTSVTFRQGLIIPESIMPGQSAYITCLSEPATGAVSGMILVRTPAGDVHHTGMVFSTGDVDGNGVSDDHATVIFPDDFPQASTGIVGEYTVFCDITSGKREGDGSVTLHSGEFWQNFWVSFQVVPESIAGALAVTCSSAAVLILLRQVLH